jgi:ATP adenylyltransferase
MAYIENDSKNEVLGEITKSGCIFCDKPAAKKLSDELIICKGEHAFVMMNIYPYNNGHVMVAPYEHTSEYESLPESTTREITSLIQQSIRALTRAFSPSGFNVGMNLGSAAGAGIAAHLHWHIVPRWVGDSNFMPVIGEVKVLPDSLESSYQKIVEAWSS